jgi:glucose/arabinose dehydrogenase
VPSAFAIPPGFLDEPVGSDWNQAVGVDFANDGRMFVWEKAGRVWNVENGVKAESPLIDISEEVGNWRDYGLLGFAIDPDFYNNGHIYLLYVVDYHHLAFFGTGNYDPNADWYFRDSIARLTRYTCNAGDGFRTVDVGSRLVLIGDTISNGFPICHQSHGIGSLAFGEDGTLLVTCGDAASYESVDIGTPTSGSSNTCLSDGIISAKEDVGAFRSQLIDSHNGKVLRIDPSTGNGLPSNPYFDGAAPDTARSRVWATGLRNPFRFTVRPDTGSPNPADADPGSLYIGDVGWYLWEDLHVCTEAGQNFGWPVFEGLGFMFDYEDEDVENLDAPNPLFNTVPPGQPFCSQAYFHFTDLIVQESLAPPSFPNPCDPNQPIPATIPRHMHNRPAVDWGHGGPARVGTFSGNDADVALVGDPASPVDGPQFGGSSSTGGVWYTATLFPPEYHDTYFHADFAGSWIRNFVFDANDQIVQIRNFAEEGTGAIVDLAMDPLEGSLHYIAYDQQGCCSIRKITWVQNSPPEAVATSDLSFGPEPLSVQFTGTGSSDPDGDVDDLTYLWDFDDGTPLSRSPNPTHTYPSEDVTPIGGFVGKIFELDPPHPIGGGNWDPEVMRDGDYPPEGNQQSIRQYDTYHAGEQGNEDWIGYEFVEEREFYGLFFQEGKHFSGGGWFEDFSIQVRSGGQWADVAALTVYPPYPGNNGISYEVFEFGFAPVTGDGIRIYGNPGGAANFISVGELRAVSAPLSPLNVPTRFDPTLTVTDWVGGADSDSISLHVNNSPPNVQITSPVDGTVLCIDENIEVQLSANISDKEHAQPSLFCAWQTILHHNEHEHPEPLDFDCETSTVLSPHGSANDVFFWETILTVYDPLGLAGMDSAIVHADCSNNEGGAIPATSDWGLLVLALTLAVLGSALFRARAMLPQA